MTKPALRKFSSVFVATKSTLKGESEEPQIHRPVYLLISQVGGSKEKVPILKVAIKTDQYSCNPRDQKPFRR